MEFSFKKIMREKSYKKILMKKNSVENVVFNVKRLKEKVLILAAFEIFCPISKHPSLY